jgi:hypothetical protein
MSDPILSVCRMVDGTAWMAPPDEFLDEDDFSPSDPDWVEPPADHIDLSPSAMLDWAEALPPDGCLVDVLHSIDSTNLTNDLQVRLAQQWARVEAAAGGQKFAAVAAVTIAGKDPDEVIDFRDSEIAAALRFSTNSARNLMATSSTLAKKAPGVLTAMQGGAIGYGHALQYAEAVTLLTPEQASRVVELTIAKASKLAPGELRQLLRKTVVRVGAEDFAKRHKEAKREVGLNVRPQADGMSSLFGWMTSLDATTIDTAAEAYARARKAEGDPRSLAQLRVAAVVFFSEQYLQKPNAPKAHGRPITINITTDLPTFVGVSDNPGEILGTGQLIPADALRDLIPDAALRRIIIDPMTGHLLDYGRTTYRFPPDLAAYHLFRAVTSTGPGSTVSAFHGDIDHPVPWDDGGETNRENGNPCNRRWHRAKTIGGWTVTQVDDGWIWTSPLGQSYKTSPHDYRLGP